MDQVMVEIAVWMGEVLIGVYRVPSCTPNRFRLDELFERLDRSAEVAKTMPPKRQWWGGKTPMHLDPADREFALR